MGLDIIYEVAHGQSKYAFRAGSYSGFHEFRNQLTNFAGDNHSMFYALLDHSDCDGELRQGECEQLHNDFVRLKGDFIAYLADVEDGQKDDESEQVWVLKLYEDWLEWTGVCAKYGGRLVFA
jgi:hypothetical protein